MCGSLIITQVLWLVFMKSNPIFKHFFSTQAHLKYVPLSTFLQNCYYAPYCTFRGNFKVKLMLEISPTPNPNLNYPDSVNKCKSDIKMHLLMQLCKIVTSLSRFDLFCWTVVSRASYQSSSSPQCNAISRELPSKPSELENSCIWSWICDANLQMHQFSNCLEFMT